MDNLEIRAKTVEEAVERALEKLALSREEVEITVVQEGKSGILGIGSEDAIIKVIPTNQMEIVEDNPIKTAQAAIGKILELMGITATVETEQAVQEEAPGTIFNIVGEDLGILIGRRGQTLSSLQQIIRLITSHSSKNWIPLNIDVEGYHKRRYATLRGLSLRLAEQVRETGEIVTLEPMPANERRIVHLTLSDSPDVTTMSVGEGEERKITICPRES